MSGTSEPGTAEFEIQASAGETDPQVEAAFEDLDVDAPRVGIVMGSKSDMPVMEAAGKVLEERGIRSETRVMSAHRDPDVVAEYAKNAHMRGIRVIIAGAGLAAALPGVVAAHTDLPGHRRAPDQRQLRGRRNRRTARHRPDAPGRPGGLRGRERGQERRHSRRPDPGSGAAVTPGRFRPGKPDSSWIGSNR